jgi:2-haloacid dehalogenase
MVVTLAFDVYGTLIDTQGVVSKLEVIAGNRAEDFSRTWRDKQLEYSFRRGLMQKYENFAVCISHALDYTCAYYKVLLTNEQKQELLDSYRTLPAFEDVEEGLIRLKAANYRLYAFSNGSADAVEALLVAAGIRDYFLGVVSVDDLKSFKPNPAVYRYFLEQSGASGSRAWLISSNPFDVIGAISADMRAAWVRRSREAIFDPWGIEPTIIVGSLCELSEQLAGYQSTDENAANN